MDKEVGRSRLTWGVTAELGDGAVALNLGVDKANKDLTVFRKRRDKAVGEAHLVAEIVPEVDQVAIESEVVTLKIDDGRGDAESLASDVFKPRVYGLTVGDGGALDRLAERSGADAEGRLVGGLVRVATCHFVICVVVCL